MTRSKHDKNVAIPHRFNALPWKRRRKKKLYRGCWA